MHIGFICPGTSGHLNPMTALGYELLKRGHKITLVGIPDSRASATEAGLGFCVVGEYEFPFGSLQKKLIELGRLSGRKALGYTVDLFLQNARLLLCEAPRAIKDAGIEALVVDQTIPSASTVAESLDIPFVNVCNALLMNQENSVPPFATGWKYSVSWPSLLRNRIGYRVMNRALKPVTDLILEYRAKWKLPLNPDFNMRCSSLAQISQQPVEFEYPRKKLPPWFHFTGPFNNPKTRKPVDFPFGMLTGQPLIYASLGTLQNQLRHIFVSIAEACKGLDMQLVISLGSSENAETIGPNLPGSPLVVPYAPQFELIKRSSSIITHGGMNTTLEALSSGVPIVAIPITNDQPGIAARLSWTGAGETVPLGRLNPRRLRKAIKSVTTQKCYKSNALRLQKAIEKGGGIQRAATIIEQAVSTQEPVLRNPS